MEIKSGDQGEIEIPIELPEDVDIREPQEGIKIWKNPINKFTVARLHYTADESKRSRQYRESIRAGMPYLDYLREYEIVWSSTNGVPVYFDDWNRAFHVSHEPLAYNVDLAIVRGWDIGPTLQPAVVFMQLLPGLRLFVYRELVGKDIGALRFTEEVHRLSMEWFPTCNYWIDVVDPTGFSRSPSNERTYVSIMQDPPLRAQMVIPGVQDPLGRTKAVSSFLKRNVRGKPALFIDRECPVLISGFDGGYHFSYITQGENRGQLHKIPVKNEYSHPHDGLQYACSKILELGLLRGGKSPVMIKEPRYGFHNRRLREINDITTVSRGFGEERRNRS